MDKQEQLAKVVRGHSSPVPLELVRTLTLTQTYTAQLCHMSEQGRESGP